jgi:hypothetical protein
MRDEPGSAARLLELVNHTRVEHGLVPLSAHEGAAAIAVEHSREMADGHDIWHNDALFTKATRDRLGAHAVAENVAMNSSADGAHERLMASDGHRANILTATFTAGAVRAVRGDDGRLYVTEVFIEPMAPARPATATTTRPAPSAVGAAKAQKPSAPPADPTPAATTSPVDPDPDRSSQPAPEDVELAAGVAFSGPLPRSAGNDGLGPMAMLAALALAGVVAALVIGIFGRAAMTA